ncbi:restriction endonuclease [Ruminococcaceae bacterium OttesenSCG-928-D13]|nr:restriction endonuclease [Ruminococcaceae bacterium OttesenSCG-928-D13]
MRKLFAWLVAALLAGAGGLLLVKTGNLWVLALGLVILAASLVFYLVATSPRRRALRGLAQVDEMDGVQFESYVAELLKRAGFRRIEATAATGDYGADLLAERDGRRYIFQCKRYAKNCGVQSVQEICGARAHYASDVEVVVTNAYFTKNAVILAQETEVELWDRDVLIGLASGAARPV